MLNQFLYFYTLSIFNYVLEISTYCNARIENNITVR